MFETTIFLVNIDVRDVSCFSYANMDIPIEFLRLYVFLYFGFFCTNSLLFFKLRSGVGRSDKEGFTCMFYNDITLIKDPTYLSSKIAFFLFKFFYYLLHFQLNFECFNGVNVINQDKFTAKEQHEGQGQGFHLAQKDMNIRGFGEELAILQLSTLTFILKYAVRILIVTKYFSCKLSLIDLISACLRF
jgi:hypothetical protein